VRTDEAVDADLQSVDNVAAATLRATNHDQAMRSRDIVMRRKRADVHRAGAASLILEGGSDPITAQEQVFADKGAHQNQRPVSWMTVFSLTRLARPMRRQGSGRPSLSF
jgi:hypothetical protein